MACGHVYCHWRRETHARRLHFLQEVCLCAFQETSWAREMAFRVSGDYSGCPDRCSRGHAQGLFPLHGCDPPWRLLRSRGDALCLTLLRAALWEKSDCLRPPLSYSFVIARPELSRETTWGLPSGPCHWGLLQNSLATMRVLAWCLPVYKHTLHLQ